MVTYDSKNKCYININFTLKIFDWTLKYNYLILRIFNQINLYKFNLWYISINDILNYIMYGIIYIFYILIHIISLFLFILFKHKILLKDIFKLMNKIIFWEIFTSCPIYHAIHIDSSKWNFFQVGHIDGKW